MIELSNVDFEKIRGLVYKQSGINLHAGKKELVKARLGKRLRDGNFRSFAEYFRFVTTKEGTDELIVMIDSISTNLTSFFREDSHFHRLRQVVPEMMKAADNGRCVPNLRIWSAGCSTGEEPYSLSIALKEIIKNRNSNLKILATDISTTTLRAAVAGVYPKEKTKKIPPLLLRKYFQIGQGSWNGYYRVKKDLKDSVEFMKFNLMETPAFHAFNDSFDIIFCRNVMIYFDKETQAGLIRRFYDCLKEKGYLFIGHSESLTGLNHRLDYIEPSVYRK